MIYFVYLWAPYQQVVHWNPINSQNLIATLDSTWLSHSSCGPTGRWTPGQCWHWQELMSPWRRSHSSVQTPFPPPLLLHASHWDHICCQQELRCILHLQYSITHQFCFWWSRKQEPSISFQYQHNKHHHHQFPVVISTINTTQQYCFQFSIFINTINTTHHQYCFVLFGNQDNEHHGPLASPTKHYIPANFLNSFSQCRQLLNDWRSVIS